MAITRKPKQPIQFPLPKHLAQGLPHRVRDGDNWRSVATANNVDVKELIHFNFETSNSDEVNWYLREKVGCRLETPDRKNYRFSSSAEPGIIYIPRIAPPAPPCPFDIRDAAAIEGRAAARTRALSGEVARRFIRTVGAVGRRGRFIPTVIDDKYWFAKLYEIVTIHEINEAAKFREPGFVLHFIPIFYELYFVALENWTNGRRGAVSRLWAVHFTRADRPDTSSALAWANSVQNSIIDGVAAHIQGDMATALERTYRSYTAKYCLDPPPPFDDFHADFFAMGGVFNRARTIMLSHVSQLGPFPEAVVALGERLAGGLSVGVVDRWRSDAWREAKRRIEQAR